MFSARVSARRLLNHRLSAAIILLPMALGSCVLSPDPVPDPVLVEQVVAEQQLAAKLASLGDPRAERIHAQVADTVNEIVRRCGHLRDGTIVQSCNEAAIQTAIATTTSQVDDPEGAQAFADREDFSAAIGTIAAIANQPDADSAARITQQLTLDNLEALAPDSFALLAEQYTDRAGWFSLDSPAERTLPTIIHGTADHTDAADDFPADQLPASIDPRQLSQAEQTELHELAAAIAAAVSLTGFAAATLENPNQASVAANQRNHALALEQWLAAAEAVLPVTDTAAEPVGFQFPGLTDTDDQPTKSAATAALYSQFRDRFLHAAAAATTETWQRVLLQQAALWQVAVEHHNAN
ncbi:hypothetical protein ACFPVT_06935 [Corynebacterium choanae]|uniref:DUF4439 domain-containing protein n=1 Tax=Corynebacterium choanae TaxID=1862358 RepID=A0A3G6J7S2_9CORY|nr:hypothetical protein [Corynebacterium choanae]AZA13823.1 hypothetical protein CCHOA_07155 [Corynebacterium choanae]